MRAINPIVLFFIGSGGVINWQIASNTTVKQYGKQGGARWTIADECFSVVRQGWQPRSPLLEWPTQKINNLQ